MRPLEQLVEVPFARRMSFPGSEGERLTHYLFKYPAKFHPPVVRYLIEQYTKRGDVILDPFCGSGTLLVEAAVSGRSAIGTDIDPLAVFIARVKTHRYKMPALRAAASKVLDHLEEIARPDKEYVRRQFDDISPATVERTIRKERLKVPAIPNLFHWFRKYVVVDLGRIITYLDRAQLAETHRDFFLLCFASIIRAASNADPVPVSGVEVTSHMKRRDKEGRIVNPVKLFAMRVNKSLADVEAYQVKANADVRLRATQADATAFSARLRERPDAVITSPPYNMAVNYYRRHLLEMYWLGLTESHEDRLALLPKYIGRDKVAKKHPFVSDEEIDTPQVKSWEAQIRKVHSERADAFKHYVVAMRKAFREIASVLKRDGHALFVVGHSRWNGKVIPTSKLFVELAGPSMVLAEHLWYPVTNRYMSYSRHNGASIDKEYVLVFKRAKPK